MNLQIKGGKRALVDKANSTLITAVAISAVITIFCLVVSKTLWDQSRFLSRVIEKKEVALTQLNANVEATDSLVKSYRAFVQEQPNVIDGSISGDGERDGDNARIVLDALPSKYDFPALATSIEKILSEQGIQIESINGTDDQVQQSTLTAGATVAPVEIPFEFAVSISTDASQGLFEKLQRSIRPMQIIEFTIESATETSVNVNVIAKTYYQPETGVQITKETIQ